MSFDLNNILAVLGTISAGSIGVWLSTEVVKSIKAIPINEGQADRIRAFAMVASSIIAAIVAWTNDSLRPDDIQAVIKDVLLALSVFGGAHGIHKAVSSGQDNQE